MKYNKEFRRAVMVLLVILGLTTGVVKAQREFRAPWEKDMKAYLLVYFKDATHGLHMALSPDGYTFTDINSGNQVMAGDTIALQKGIRDPHITRGPDGMFYLAMTDLHIFAQKAGYRSTEWERDGKLYGWGNNRSLVLMKSKDLIHWSRTILRVDQAFPGLEEIGCAWAPQTIYDESKKKLMLYFTMRFRNGNNKLYYTYMNDAFTAMETTPQLLFQYPKDITYIDADITKTGNKYHMFYVPHDGVPGIKQAVSDSIHSGYQYAPQWIDPEPQACEAPTVFKRIGQDKWVLIYDIYGINPHNFGFSETTDFVNFTPIGHFNEGVMKTTNFSSPKHGAVVHLTRKEAKRLAKHWKLKMKF
ncbi:glycoside hydrolase family 43 protein [Rufibacter aurantiacus]|uniref:glycoside hydrolase family 43 protein n=1 Tax=Rufibacter aurantiacus TaxID=2817374 RepID=UPI001B305E7A|nr:glycoside hydrolase family 43 protein [Rufibacter aurantiacus]